MAYHSGEIDLQKRFGETDMAGRVSRVINNKIIGGAIPFIENQPFIIVSSTDANGQIWTSMLMGAQGWIDASTEGKVRFELGKLQSVRDDIFFENIKINNQVGIVLIELGTRRRYRLNGRIQLDDVHIHLEIQEAYPNCPKYIQRRVPSIQQNQKETYAVSKGAELSQDLSEWINQADTFFVGSQSQEGRLDASHRGGDKGFIEILDSGALKIPDYVGNSMFNTLGNLNQVPKAGLLFIDFELGRVLQLTGSTGFLFDQEGEENDFITTGTGRFWTFQPESWILTEQHHKIEWEFIDSSPFNPNAS